jgi:hypothetical protein
METARARVAAVLGYVHAKPAKPLHTPRQWEAFWKPREQWALLSRLLQRLGWEVTLLPGRESDHIGPIAAQDAAEGNVAMVFAGDLEEVIEQAHATGLHIPFSVDDAAVLALAAELYAIACSKIGRPPRDAAIDELGAPLFQQQILGLPFSPMVFALSRADS